MILGCSCGHELGRSRARAFWSVMAFLYRLNCCSLYISNSIMDYICYHLQSGPGQRMRTHQVFWLLDEDVLHINNHSSEEEEQGGRGQDFSESLDNGKASRCRYLIQGLCLSRSYKTAPQFSLALQPPKTSLVEEVSVVTLSWATFNSSDKSVRPLSNL